MHAAHTSIQLARRTRRRCVFSLVVLLVLALPTRADDGADLKIPIGGETRTATDLAAMEQAVREEITELAAMPAPDAAQRAARMGVMDAQAAALLSAATLMKQIEEAPGATAQLGETLVAERNTLATLQEAAAAPPEIESPVEESRIRALETASGRAAQDVKDADTAATRLEDQRKRRQAELDTLDARGAQLTLDRQALATQLAATPEADTRARDLLERRIQTNEVRQAVVGLKRAHRETLIELETLRETLARVRVELATGRQRICTDQLERAREVYQGQLEAEAGRKQAEAERRLREAERADSAAGKAISRLSGLVGLMETELAHELKLTSELKAVEAEGRALLQEATTRYESLRVLYPAGKPLAPWQEDSIEEQLRRLELDRSALDTYRAEFLPDLNGLLAERLTTRGQLESFRNRIASTEDRIERSRDADSRAATIERDLAHNRNSDYELWLKARRDFLQGRNDDRLSAEDAAALRVAWEQTATRLRELTKQRLDEQDLQITRIGEIQSAMGATIDAVEGRRAHLDRLTFWLQSDAMLSAAYLEDLGVEARSLGERIAEAPAHLGALRPASLAAGILALAGAIGALGLGLWLRRRERLRPEPAAGDRARRMVLLSAVGQVAARVFLPVALLGIAVFVRATVFPGDAATLVPIAIFGAWTGFALSSALIRVYLTLDENGACVAGCARTTMIRARRVVRLGFQGSAILFAGVLLLQAAGAPHIAASVGFLWGLLFLLVGTLLVIWPDVLSLLVPLPAGTILARTIYGTLRVLWPLFVLFGAAALTLYALGYRNASVHYASRALLLGTLLGAIGIVYGVLRLLLDARKRPDSSAHESDDAPVHADFALGRRFLGGVLSLATLGAVWLAITVVFDLSWEDWQGFADLSLVGGAPGVGLTPGKLGHALLWLLLSFGIARYARDLVRGVLRSSKLPVGSRYAVRTLLFYTIVTVGVVASLSALGVRLDQFGWFLAAAGVGIGFGLQEIISNFVCGLILFFERPVQVGDIITVGDVEGDVTGISIRSTVVRTGDGVSMILPNKKLITEDVVNWSHGEQRTRLNVDVSVAYGSDIAKVKAILQSIAADERRVLRYPAPEVDFHAFGESELQFLLRIWLATPNITARRRIRTAVLTEVDRRFAESDVEIPFPQRDLHLRSSDIGHLAVEPTDPAQSASAPDA